jgi:hypothetical protein
MKKRTWLIIIIAVSFIIGKFFFTLISNFSKNSELGPFKVGFNISPRDTSYLLESTIREIDNSYTLKMKSGRESSYWLKDGSVLYISNILLPEKFNLINEFDLIEAKGGSKEYAIKDFYSTEFKGGEFFTTVTKPLSEVKYCYFQKGGTVEVKLRNEDTLQFTGTPGFLNLTNEINDKGTLGCILKDKNTNVEVLFINSKYDGGLMILYLPKNKASQHLEELLK